MKNNTKLSYLFPIVCLVVFIWKVDTRCNCRKESGETRVAGSFLIAENPPDSPSAGCSSSSTHSPGPLFGRVQGGD